MAYHDSVVVGCGEMSFDFRAMPKIELHAHLSGSISRRCLHEIWVKKQRMSTLQSSIQDPLLEMPEGKFDYDLKSFFPLFSSYIYQLCNDRESIVYSTQSVLRDFEADGVIYLELRTTPRAISNAGITKSDYVELVLQAINSHSSEHMVTKLILSIDRRNTAMEAMQVVDLAIEARSQGVVGVDLCGDPTVGNVCVYREAFAKAKQHGLGITIHFAEAPQSSSDLELSTILSFMPDRIGHVINVPEGLRRQIVLEKLGLELCLSCNVHAKMITGGYGNHHFGYWHKTGCPIVLCTDDVGIFGSDLSNEYCLIAEHFHLTNKEITELARSGISSIFAGPLEIARLDALMWRSHD